MSIRVEPERLISLSTEASRLKNIVDSQREVVESIERVLDYSLRTRAGIDEHLHRLRYVLASKVRQLEALEHHLVTSGKQYEAVDKQVCLMLGQELEIYEKALEHKAWYESNEFKFAVGAAVIAGLAVAAITIGGPILMGMLVGAAAGAVIGGAIGGVSSTLSGGDFWDGAADGWMVGSISGAITGGVAATGVGVAGAVLTDGLVDSGVYVYETVSKGKSVDPLGLGLSFAVGAGVSFLGTKASSALTKHFEKFRISNSVDEVIEGGSTSPKEIIANRLQGFDLTPHPIQQKQLSSAKMNELKTKIKNRTITKDEYRLYDWNKRLSTRRSTGVKEFWNQERERLINGETPTRNWDANQTNNILNGKTPKVDGKSIQGHHSYSVSQYPQLANKGEGIYPATLNEHFNGWHGGNFKNSLPGEPIRVISDFD